MASTKLYLDNRKPRKDGTSPLKLSICKKGVSSQISLGIFLQEEQWNSEQCKIIKHPNKSFLNSFIQSRKSDADQFILKLRLEGTIGKYDSKRIRDELKQMFEPESTNDKSVSLYEYIIYNSTLKVGDTTKMRYVCVANAVKSFCKDYESLYIKDIDNKWIRSFMDYLIKDRKLVNNSVVAYMTILKTCFGQAIEENIIESIPFYKIKLKMNTTIKRNLNVEELRYLFNYTMDKRYKQMALDCFKLQFLLIGINTFDLAILEDKISKEGRIEYYRAKTKKLYSIKVENEALEIINKYRNGDKLFPIMRKRVSEASKHTLAGRINEILKTIKSDIYDFSNLTTYYSRHSWATIAHEIGVEKDVISLALGHSFRTLLMHKTIN